jgi:hypothetical protein
MRALDSDWLVLRGTLYRPIGRGHAPVVVHDHGSERDPGIGASATARLFHESDRDQSSSGISSYAPRQSIDSPS